MVWVVACSLFFASRLLVVVCVLCGGCSLFGVRCLWFVGCDGAFCVACYVLCVDCSVVFGLCCVLYVVSCMSFVVRCLLLFVIAWSCC